MVLMVTASLVLIVGGFALIVGREHLVKVNLRGLSRSAGVESRMRPAAVMGAVGTGLWSIAMGIWQGVVAMKDGGKTQSPPGFWVLSALLVAIAGLFAFWICREARRAEDDDET